MYTLVKRSTTLPKQFTTYLESKFCQSLLTWISKDFSKHISPSKILSTQNFEVLVNLILLLNDIIMEEKLDLIIITSII